MTDTLKNSWKLFAVSATRSKARHVRNAFHIITHNIKLRFFILFALGLFVTYVLVDVMTTPALQTLGYSLFVDYSPEEIVRLMRSHTLVNFSEASLTTKISILLFICLTAYSLATIAMQPVNLFKIKRRYFTSNIAHELNTPLSVLKATAEVTRMRGHEMTPAERAEFTMSIIEEVDRMAEIVKYFLHFGGPEQKSQLLMSPVNMSSVVSKAVRTLSWLATQCEIIIEVPRDDAEVVWGNFTALEEMTLGLIKNAIIHSPKGGVVKLAIKGVVGHVHLTIWNAGEGISEADLPYIFDPFYKGESTIRCGQLGLGLTIAREIAKLHLAEINVRSDPKTGTKFTIKLPK